VGEDDRHRCERSARFGKYRCFKTKSKGSRVRSLPPDRRA
jgi:hypothetical protein